MFFIFCPYMPFLQMFIYRVKKTLFVTYSYIVIKKNVKILQVFPQFFELFSSFFGILGQKWKNLRKKKKTCFFVFPLRLGGCLIWATLFVSNSTFFQNMPLLKHVVPFYLTTDNLTGVTNSCVTKNDNNFIYNIYFRKKKKKRKRMSLVNG